MARSNMFTLAVVALLLGEMVCVLCTPPLPAIHQDKGLKLVSVGDTVTLHCFYEGDTETTFSWYKQTLGHKPLLVSNLFKFNKNPTFYNEFKGNPRFTVQSAKGIHHLSISALDQSDSATYYCVTGYVNTMEFAEGTVLYVKGPGSNTKTLVRQPASESVQPGNSVTLNCTVHTETVHTCAGEHGVYWFRHGSGESRPGIIYTHGNRSGQCGKSPEAGSPTQSCVYSLPKTNLSLSDAGTYYCAVASCGEILFGDGTTLDFQERRTELVYCLCAASVVFFILTIVLAGIVFKMNKRTCPHCKGVVSQASASIRPADREEQESENLHYAALKMNKNRPRRQRGKVETETVYSGVRQ